MLIGAHVSPAGGPAKAVGRGVECDAQAIQIFNQNPRAWKPREYSEEEIAAYHEAMAGSQVDALLIHAVYLLNCASEDADIRSKSLTSLIASLRAGDALGAHAVVLHPGSALGGDAGPALARAGGVIAEALAESETCPLHLENTAGAGGTLGRSFHELAALLEHAGGDERLGVCLDSCHLLASGFDIRTAEGLTAVLDECVALVGLERVRSLHLNDSQTPLGSNRDRHASVGEGELGPDGCAVFLSEPRFQDLPCVLETPGPHQSGPTAEELARTRALRERGLAARGVSGRGRAGSPAAMATQKQRAAAKRNVKKAQAGAKKKQTLKNMPKRTKTAMGKESATVQRGDAPTRDELLAEARKLDIRGRSKMGKADLKRAVARAKR